MIAIDQLLDARKSVLVLCEPNYYDVSDPELDVILADSILDFLRVDSVDAWHSLQGPKEAAYNSTKKENEGSVPPSLDLNKECLLEEKPCVGNMDLDLKLPNVESKLLMQLIFGVAI